MQQVNQTLIKFPPPKFFISCCTNLSLFFPFFTMVFLVPNLHRAEDLSRRSRGRTNKTLTNLVGWTIGSTSLKMRLELPRYWLHPRNWVFHDLVFFFLFSFLLQNFDASAESLMDFEYQCDIGLEILFLNAWNLAKVFTLVVSWYHFLFGFNFSTFRGKWI